MMAPSLSKSGPLLVRVELVLRVLVAVGLAVDAIVHLKLASGYQLAAPSGIGEGSVFRIQSGVALAVAGWVLLRGSRPAYLTAALVGLSAVAAVLLYRYVDIAGFGPIPPMYEPIWSSDKRLSAVAEGLAGILALAGAFLTRPVGRSGRPARGRLEDDLAPTPLRPPVAASEPSTYFRYDRYPHRVQGGTGVTETFAS